jgi:hypothetical protein
VRPERGLRPAVALCAMASLLLVPGCASDDEDGTSRDSSRDGRTARDGGTRPAGRAPGEGDPSERDPAERNLEDRDRADRNTRERDRSAGRSSSTPSLKLATCPSGAGNCRSASGRVIYVERVDPDGDGDAHFVLASRHSITGPGISVIDVKRSLRPSPLPDRGDRMSAAGPVYRGSYGQRQIEAVELNVARTR